MIKLGFLYLFLSVVMEGLQCVSFESPRKQEYSLRDKIDSLKNVKYQKDVMIHYIQIRSRRKMSMTRNNLQYFIYYTPQIHELIPAETNATDYTTYLSDVDIDLTQAHPLVPNDFSRTITSQYKINDDDNTPYIFEETYSFTAQRQDSIYNRNDFQFDSISNNSTDQYDDKKLMEFLENKNQIEGNTNSIFIIVLSEFNQTNTADFTLFQHASKDTNQTFLFGYMSEFNFYQDIHQANEIVGRAYFKVNSGKIHEQKTACISHYIKSIQKIEQVIIESIEAGSQLLMPETKISDIFELEEYFSFQQIWKEVVTRYEFFFYLINTNKFASALKTIQESESYFSSNMVTFLRTTLTKEDVEQTSNFLIQLLKQYTFSLMLFVFLLLFVYIYIQKSQVLELFGKKFV